MKTIVYLHDGSEIEHPNSTTYVGEASAVVVDPPSEHVVLDADNVMTTVHTPGETRTVVNPDGAPLFVISDGTIVAAYEPGTWRSTTTALEERD